MAALEQAMALVPQPPTERWEATVGRVQVDPIKLKLTPPGTKRLKLQCDIFLSNFVSNSTCAATPRW